jgi:hypothetical protein
VQEFGLDPMRLVGLTSDGAAVMVAAGKELGIIHQLCLGPCTNDYKYLFSVVIFGQF